MNQKATIFLFSLIALTLGIYLSVFGLKFPSQTPEIDVSDIEGFFWPQQKKLGEFELVDQDSGPYDLNRLKDKWRFVFFGYTHCPDICPITMVTMRETRAKIISANPDVEKNIGFVFVSVDGERDTPDHLKSYLQFFGDYFEGATGNKEQVDSLASQLGVPYSIDDHEPGDTDYLVGHSGAIFLISPRGSLASIYQPPLSPEDISDRFLNIMQFMQTQS